MSTLVEIRFRVQRSDDITDRTETVGIHEGRVVLPDVLLSQVHASKVVIRQAVQKKVDDMLDLMLR